MFKLLILLLSLSGCNPPHSWEKEEETTKRLENLEFKLDSLSPKIDLIIESSKELKIKECIRINLVQSGQVKLGVVYYVDGEGRIIIQTADNFAILTTKYLMTTQMGWVKSLEEVGKYMLETKYTQIPCS